MAKTDGPATSPPSPSCSWGTLEELLLVCAVNRYGTQSWDSIATEIQKRTTIATTPHSFTPETCQQKYTDLKHRFSSSAGVIPHHPPETARISSSNWLDELRKLRIAELRRELERYDLSIMSLQTKVKTLKEERDQSLREKLEGGGSDLEINPVVEEKREQAGTSRERSSPGSGSGRNLTVSDEGENQSVNESNSTDLRPGGVEEGVEEPEEEEQQQLACAAVEERGRADREVSDNGSSDTVAATEYLDTLKRERPAREKESSDVQSSAGLSRKIGPETAVCGSNSCDCEVVETGNQSPAGRSGDGKSQPLIDLLEVIRSHKAICSIFQGRLPSQEAKRYKNLIRQHVDIHTIWMRLKAGDYDSLQKFRRDLLLLVNNAILFFPHNSSEHKAAVQLRLLMADHYPHNCTPNKSPLTPDPRPKLEDHLVEPLLLKRNLSGPVVACQKQSSIISTDDAVEVRNTEVKPACNAAKNKGSRDQRNVSKNTKSRSSSNDAANKLNLDSQPSSCGLINGHSTQGSEHEKTCDRKASVKKKRNTNGNTTAAASSTKKQGASNFLNRMLRSTSNNRSLPLRDLLTNGDSNRGKGAAAEQNRKVERKQSLSKQANDKKKEKQSNNERVSKASAEGKNGGRPPTKARVVPSATGKRKHGGVVDVLPSKRQRK